MSVTTQIVTTRLAMRRIAVAAAFCLAFVGLASKAADARVFVGIGIPFYGPAYYPPYYYPYAPAPYYYAPPPVVYAPPQAYVPPASTAGGAQSCHAEAYVCPMDRPVAAGSGCYCLGNAGQRIYGRAS